MMSKPRFLNPEELVNPGVVLPQSKSPQGVRPNIDNFCTQHSASESKVKTRKEKPCKLFPPEKPPSIKSSNHRITASLVGCFSVPSETKC